MNTTSINTTTTTLTAQRQSARDTGDSTTLSLNEGYFAKRNALD